MDSAGYNGLIILATAATVAATIMQSRWPSLWKPRYVNGHHDYIVTLDTSHCCA